MPKTLDVFVRCAMLTATGLVAGLGAYALGKPEIADVVAQVTPTIATPSIQLTPKETVETAKTVLECISYVAVGMGLIAAPALHALYGYGKK